MAENNTVTPPVTNTAATPAPAEGAAKPAATAPEAGKSPSVAPTEAQKAAVVAEVRRLKLKMDGNEVEVPEDEVVKMAQQAGVSAKRFQEASALKKQAEQVLELLASKPTEALKKLVTDPKAYRKIIEDELIEMVKREQESPEAKKIREQEEKLQSYEKKERELAEAAEKQKQEDEKSAKEKDQNEKTAKFMKQYEELFVKALEESGLPKNAYTIRRMAALQQANLRTGYELDATSIAKIVRQDYDNEHTARLEKFKSPDGKFDGEKLLEFFGEEAVKAMNRAQVKKLKSANAQKFATPTQETSEPPKPTGSWREFSKRKRMLS